MPFVPLCGDWEPVEDPSSFLGLYRQSFANQADVDGAAIAVEAIPRVLLIAGGDDRVWPSLEEAERISERRKLHGLATTVVTDLHAGHRTVLPGEPVVTAGTRVARGGNEEADRRLGAAAWPHIAALL